MNVLRISFSFGHFRIAYIVVILLIMQLLFLSACTSQESELWKEVLAECESVVDRVDQSKRDVFIENCGSFAYIGECSDGSVGFGSASAAICPGEAKIVRWVRVPS